MELGFMKLFFESSPTEDNCFKSLILVFPGQSIKKNEDR